MIVDPILPQERIEAMRAEGWWRDENLLDYVDAALATHADDVAVVLCELQKVKDKNVKGFLFI